MIDRRKFLQASVAAGLASSAPFRHFVQDAFGEVLMPGLSDPALQPIFTELAPNALDPGYIQSPVFEDVDKVAYEVAVRLNPDHETGLVGAGGVGVKTPIWGYVNSQDTVATWPGKTFEVRSASAGGPPETHVTWRNQLGASHLLPVDTNLHWCYSLDGYDGGVPSYQRIAALGVPIITHLHGGHTDFQFDGNPEFFHTPGEAMYGPSWNDVPGGRTNVFRYDNGVHAGNLWYHDHALGITRLNVYAGLAGFYFIRDEYDTGEADNPIGLPAFPYELAYAIQDRMFRDTGELFYSGYPGDPFYADFIDEEGAVLPADLFPNGGPTALAEFFGDHMLVNGKIWPKADVEPRNYRMRLLNGTDSRFMMLQFRAAAAGETDPANGTPLDFVVIGCDQGLARSAKTTQRLLFEPGARYDVVVDFSQVPAGSRVIMSNLLGDAPFGGELPDEDDLFPNRRTDRVMAFDVNIPFKESVPDNFGVPGFNMGRKTWNYGGNKNKVDVTRQVALFEGVDEFGRLQPLLGNLDETDGLFKGVPWHLPVTETPALGATEVWEIYNFTGDAHPVHLHLVNFEVVGRQLITFDEDGELPTEQHNGTYGSHPRVTNVAKVTGPAGKVKLGPRDGYADDAPRDMVTALPGTVTKIKATFDKPGRYVWHCHILSHEDHEMMRVLEVVD
jgi:spore coat protein A